MNKQLRLILKGVITSSTMIACEDFVSFYSKGAFNIPHKVAGLSIGFMLGREVSDCVLDAVEGAIDAYNSYGGNN